MTGTLFIPSPSARQNYIADVDVVVCRSADKSESERLEAQSARLSFTTDQVGETVIGATGTYGRGGLTQSTIDGESMCGWEVSFSVSLPPDTTVFFIQYGYTDYYWGPYSNAEGEKGIGVAVTQ